MLVIEKERIAKSVGVVLPDVKKVGSYLEISRDKNENYAQNSEELSKR